MAYEAPSGLMGRPEDTERFEAFEVSEITIYVAAEVMEEELKGDTLNFYVEGYGKYELKIME
ncbi:MAG: hypothetical protein ACM3ZR_02885 [Pseudomonadota bacterium]